MIQIRKGVFETNSSSSHSIVMTKESKPNEKMVDPDWRVDENGIMAFWYEPDLEFGRSPFDLLTDWYGRLRYAIASYAQNDEKIREIEEICFERITGFTGFKFEKDKWDNTDNRGYVDHESAGLLQSALKKYNTSLEDFIFDDRFIVVIDGDEYCVTKRLIESDLFKKDEVEDITSVFYDLDSGGWKEE